MSKRSPNSNPQQQKDAATDASSHSHSRSQHPGDDDVLLSIRAVKELYEQEFRDSAHQRRLVAINNSNSNTNTDGSRGTSNSNNNDEDRNNKKDEATENALLLASLSSSSSDGVGLGLGMLWKQQCSRLKQELSEVKKHQSVVLEQHQDELTTMTQNMKDCQQELALERAMKRTLEQTIEAMNAHTTQLTEHLASSKQQTETIQTNLSSVLVSVEEEKSAMDTERRTYQTVIDESKQRIQHLTTKSIAEETHRLRTEQKLRTTQETCHKHQTTMQQQIRDSELKTQQHTTTTQSLRDAIDAMKKKAAAQRVASSSPTTTTTTNTPILTLTDDRSTLEFKTDLIIKSLKVQVSRLQKQNTKLLHEKDERITAATAANAAISSSSPAVASATVLATTAMKVTPLNDPPPPPPQQQQQTAVAATVVVTTNIIFRQ